MDQRLLTKEEYEELLSPDMVNVTETADEIVDLWGYADPIIETEYHNCSAWEWKVNHVYESNDGLYQHIGIAVPLDDTYLVVIVKKNIKQIVGHYVVDLGALYRGTGN